MYIDHIGVMLNDLDLIDNVPYVIMRAAGRLAMPLYVFLLIQGFYHTRSFWKYFTRIAILALLTEIPYNLFHKNAIFDPAKQNILIAYALGLLMIYVIHILWKKDLPGKIAGAAVAIAVAVAAYFLKLDYGWRVPAIIYTTYLGQTLAMLPITIVCGTVITVLGRPWYLWTTPFAYIPVGLYNGERGKCPKWLNIVFYGAYPMSYLLLYIVEIIVKEAGAAW